MNYLKIIKIALIVITLNIVIACSAQQINFSEERFGSPTPTPVITCIHKYDETVVIKFYEGNIQRFVLNDITMFRVLGLDNKEYFLNIYEIENYTCFYD